MTKSRKIQAKTVTINTDNGPVTYKKHEGDTPPTGEFLMVTEDGAQIFFVKEEG